MPQTFTALFLGNLADIDTTEGNYTAENASALVGQTFGAPGDALLNNAVTWSAVKVSGSVYDMNNSTNEKFSIDGGPAQTFDATSVYKATVTFADGSTGNISAVVAQDTDGNTYLMPEFSDNQDQGILQSGPIQSITLNSLLGNRYSGLTASRETWDLVTCFTSGTSIATDRGERRIDDLRIGDRVQTLDNGLQCIRWIGRRTVPAQGAFAPVRIKAGAFGNRRDLLVSPQHRMLVRDWRVELNTGHPEALCPAKHLLGGPYATLQTGGNVTYFHLLFDRHELIWAEGSLSESFHPGTLSWTTLTAAARAEILALFPQIADHGPASYGPSARPSLKRFETLASVA